jgi:hypothetical protein
MAVGAPLRRRYPALIETQKHKIVNLTPPAAIVNNATVTVAALDTLGFAYSDLVVALGATDIPLSVLKLTESDDNITYTDVPGSDFSVAPATLPSATDDNNFFAWHVQMTGSRKRYLKPAITVGNGATGAFVCVLGILSRAQQAPSTAAGRGYAQELFV